MFRKIFIGLAASILFFSSFIFSGTVFAADVLIDEDGNIESGTSNMQGNLRVVGGSGEDAVAGESVGAGVAGVVGQNIDDGSFGALGLKGYGVYGYNNFGYAGYFMGDAGVSGALDVGGMITATGINILGGGTISETYIDTIVTRDGEIMPIVLSSDGSGSGLDADKLDGKDSSEFVDSASQALLEGRVSALEQSDDLVDLVKKTARSVSDRTYIAVPELETWIKAAQKGSPGHFMSGLTEVDSDGDGAIIVGTDMTNLAISAAGVVTTFVSARTAMREMSPWNEAVPLWANGGPAANQMACNAAGAAHPGQITLCFNPWEDMTIKNIFVSAYDNEPTPNLFYQKSVSGYTDIERREFMIESAKDAIEELEAWMKAAQKAGNIHPQGWLTEVDTDGDGAITINTDMPNTPLATAGVVTTFIASRVAMGEVEPWYGMALWTNGGVAHNQAACTAAAAGTPGQIMLCYTPAEDETITRIFVSVYDNNTIPNLLYEKSIIGFTNIERRESMVASAKEGVSELEKWIKAVQKGGSNHPYAGLTEIDTDGDGAVVIGTDFTNRGLEVAGAVTTFIQSRLNMPQFSPWDGSRPLWVDGGPVANKSHCNMAGAANPGQITLCYLPAQDFTMKNIFVSAYDNEATPDLLYEISIAGTSDTERRDSIVASVKEELTELANWMAAVRKGWGPDGGLTEVDSDGDGVVLEGTDLTNDALAMAGVITQFIASRMARGDVSPWPASLSLWVNGGAVANQPACNVVAAAHPGQATLCFNPAEDETIGYIFISVADNDPVPNIIYKKTLSAN